METFLRHFFGCERGDVFFFGILFDDFYILIGSGYLLRVDLDIHPTGNLEIWGIDGTAE